MKQTAIALSQGATAKLHQLCDGVTRLLYVLALCIMLRRIHNEEDELGLCHTCGDAVNG